MLKAQNQDYELLANILTTGARLAFMEKLAGLGYWELDVKNRKIYCSEEIYRILGVESSFRHALNLRNLMPPEDYDIFLKCLQHLYHQKIKIYQEIKLKHSDGSFRYCQLRADFFYVRDYAMIAGTIQDLSLLIEAKQQLIAARNQAEKLNKDKSFFLAQASHDLRQPMQALSLYLDLMCPDNFNAAQQKLWRKINDTAENLKSLLNNVLDLSKLDYGGTKADKHNFNIGLLLSDLGREFYDIAECKSLVFEYSICNCIVFSDAFLVERVLRNLLSNAFKFARQKVEICCCELKNRVEISVQDDGSGISKEEQEHIFEEFYRGKNSYESKIDGAGLGLTIVQKIISLLDSEIKIESSPGQGSRFFFSLPKVIP